MLAERQFWEGEEGEGDRANLLARVSWILREQGRPAEALNRLQSYVAARGDAAKIHAPLLAERAAAYIALKQWEKAEADLQSFLAREQWSYALYVQACLARGFLRERRGDAAGAVQAWQEGLLKNFQQQGTARQKNLAETVIFKAAPGLTSVGAIDTFNGTAVASLANDFATAEADEVLTHLLGRISMEKSGMSLIRDRIPMPSGIVRDMWLSPRGGDCRCPPAGLPRNLLCGIHAAAAHGAGG